MAYYVRAAKPRPSQPHGRLTPPLGTGERDMAIPRRIHGLDDAYIDAHDTAIG